MAEPTEISQQPIDGQAFHFQVIDDRVKEYVKSLFRCLYNNESSKLRYAYFVEFSSVTEEFYKQNEWPTLEEIEQFVEFDLVFKGEKDKRGQDESEKYSKMRELFTILYNELTFRHIFLHGKPLLEHRIHSYDNYIKLFNFLLDYADVLSAKEGKEDEEKDPREQVANPGAAATFSLPRLPMEWLADMLDEFLYQFEDFCSLRHQLKDVNDDEREDLEALDEPIDDEEDISVKGVFGVATAVEILTALSGLCDFKNENQGSSLWVLGYFATLGLSRVQVLLADYYLALKTLKNIDLDDRRALFTKVNSVHVTFFYYTGFAYLMMKRYQDAIGIFSAILLAHNPNDKSRLRTVCYADAQFQRKYEKLRALCCMAVALTPGMSLEDNLKNVLNEAKAPGNASDNLLRTLRSRTEENLAPKDIFSEVFNKNSPRFITPRRPDYKTAQNTHRETADIQVKRFLSQVESQSQLPELRSLLKLYSSISVPKLSQLSHLEEKEVLRALILIKSQSQQFVRSPGSSENEERDSQNEFHHENGFLEPVSDLHYFLENNFVNVDEKQRKQKFADFFLQNALRLGQSANDLKANNTSRGGKRFQQARKPPRKSAA